MTHEQSVIVSGFGFDSMLWLEAIVPSGFRKAITFRNVSQVELNQTKIQEEHCGRRGQNRKIVIDVVSRILAFH